MPVEFFDAVVRVGYLIATTLLFAIVLLAYRRMRSQRMLLITAGFGVAWVHAIVTIPELLITPYDVALDENVHLLLFLITLILILLGTLKD